MAELDEKLLKALDDRLKNMLTTITSLGSALNTVVANSKSSLTDLISLFQASGASLTDMLQAFKGNRLADLLGIKDATSNVKELKEEIERLQKSVDLHGDAKKEVSEKGKVSWFVPEGKEWDDNGERQREAINRLEKARQELKDISLSDEQIMERIVSLINKAATETQKEEEARARGLQKASEQQAVLAKSYKEIEEARSIVSGGKKYGELMKTGGEQFKKYEEFSRILTSIKEQQDAIEKEWAGSKDKGAEIYKQEQAIANAKREASEAQKQAKQEEARQEKELNKAIAEEARRKKEDENEYLRLLKERNKLLEQNARLAENKRNAGLTGYIDTSNYFGSQQDKNDARLRQLNDEIQLYEESVKLTADGQRRKEEMELAHENRMTEIKVQGEQKREQILDRSSKKRQSESERNARKAESIQKQADTLSKRRIDLNNEISRIEHDRAIRQKTNTNITQQALDAEEKKYQALKDMVDQLTASLAELEKKQSGVTAKAEAKNAPYQQYTQAKEEERVNAELEKRNKLLKDNKRTMDSMLPTLQRLASAFGVAFSVRGLAQFGKKLIETRGEFEMQFVAMKQIIGDVDAATKIWNQTMQQALQSPFKAMQLVTYTKQLAAYRIETEKLFDTTKRLADVSAGLGVDMQRLILAYGQVKAANFLRASEIRQFTEAGVNILGELSKYFTEIRGQAYSTAQVMEMVTKRMVRFEDVEEIFKRMTDAGGTFFNMQEVQANTVKGQINKLHDAYDQMLNTIGQANQGVIRNFISLLIDMVKNWQKVANTMKWVGGILGSVIIATRAMRIEMEATAFAEAGTAISLRGLSGAMARYIAAAKGAETATRGFSLALKSVPVWGWILAGVSALIGVGSAIASKQRQIREETEAFNESTKELRKDIAYVDSYTNAIVKLSTEIKALNEIENKTEEQEKRLVEAQEERERLIKELAETNPQYANNIKALKDDVDALLASEKEELETLKATLAIRQALKDEGVKGKVEEYESATAAENKAVSDIENNKIAIIDYIGTLNEAGEVESKLLDNLREQSGTMSAIGKEGMSELESEVESFARTVNEDILNFDEAYGRFVELYVKLSNGISKSAGQGAYYSNFIQVFKDAAQYGKELSDAQWNTYSAEIAIKGVLDEVFSKYKYYDQYISLSRSFEKATTDEEKQKVRTQILKFWSDVFEQEGFVGASRKLAEDYFISMIGGSFGIESFSQSSNAVTKELQDWQKRVNDAFDKIKESYDKKIAELDEESRKKAPELTLFKITDPLTTLEQVQEDVLNALKIVQAGIASFEVKGQVAINNEEYKFLKLQEEALEQQRIAVGAALKNRKSGGTKENASKLISLIKEMRSEYDKLSKSAYGYAKSEEKVRESYAQSVEKILGKAGVTKDYDFTTNEGMIAALNKVLVYANKLGPEAAAEVQKYIDQLETEIEINAQVKIKEDFGRQIEKMFSDYELSLNFESMGIPEDLAKDLFGIDTSSLDEISSYLERFATEHAEDWNEDINKIYADALKKISDKEQEQYKKDVSDLFKRVKSSAAEMKVVIEQACEDINFAQNLFDPNYVDQATKDIRAKIQQNLEEINRLTPSEGKAEGVAAQQIARLEAENKILENRVKRLTQMYGNISAEQYTDLVRSTIEWENERAQKISMEQLKRMPEYLEAMGRTAGWSNVKLREMLDYLKDLISVSGSDMSLEDYKTVVNQIDKIQEQIKSNNYPFGREGFAKVAQMLEEQSEAEGQMKQLEEERIRLQEESKRLNEELVGLQERLNALKAENHEENKDEIREVEDQIEENLRNQNQNANQQRKVAAGIQTITKGNMQTMVIIDAIIHAVNDTVQDLYKSLEKIEVILQDYSIDTEHGSWAKWTKGMETFAKASQDATNGWEAFKKGDVAGIMLEVVNGIVDIWHGINEIVNQKQVDTIYFNEEKIEDLKRAYERLDKQIAKTWDTVSYMQNYTEMTDNLYEQIKALNQQLAAEEAKKNTDKEAVKDYQDKIQDAEDELENLKQAQIEVFGGLGEEGYRDAAQGFVDAWKSAFLETGDGLQGLQDHFDEFLNDWFVKQATMRYASAALEPVFRMIDEAVDVNSPGGVDVLMSELEAIKEWARINFPQISETLEEISRPFIEGGEGSLSGLSAGIQGMTEEQANILEAYWNSVRGYTASIDMNVATIVGLLSNGTKGGGEGKGGSSDISGSIDYNPQLQQLELIAQNTRSINSLLQSVTKSGHSQGGYGIKVFAD